jgi:hypothetical protein
LRNPWNILEKNKEKSLEKPVKKFEKPWKNLVENPCKSWESFKKTLGKSMKNLYRKLRNYSKNPW